VKVVPALALAEAEIVPVESSFVRFLRAILTICGLVSIHRLNNSAGLWHLVAAEDVDVPRMVVRGKVDEAITQVRRAIRTLE
jgi:hypothetical protein